jgi:pyruvate dehydrogenase E2 component (dihydrolipoamide acetyltransferase)
VAPSTSSVYIDTNDSTCQIKEDLSKPIHHNNHEETTTPADESNGNRVIASPLAKKLASELGVNLNGITGSGPNGRIIKDDIISAGVEKFKGNTQSQASSQSKFTDLPLSSMRKVIASRLTESKKSIPHYYLKVEVEMDRILELRAKFNSNDLLQESFGIFKLSVNDFIVKAAALALKKVPECNSSWQGEFIRQHENVDICVAVATPAGLITPIIPDSDLKGLVAISGTVKELAQRAKINKLKPHEYQVTLTTIFHIFYICFRAVLLLLVIWACMVWNPSLPSSIHHNPAS